jgi:adenylate kinase
MATQSQNERAAWLQGPSAQCEAPEATQHPFRLVLLGPPGVGKGTQADLLREELHACHLSTGDVFRAASKSQNELSPAMKNATEFMRRGALVPDATVWAMILERIRCLRCGAGFILDGFPRTPAQAASLQQLMQEEKLQLTAVVNYYLPESEIVVRLSGRRTCEKCRTVFHIVERPPKTDGCCDRCGGSLYQREDDQPDSIRVRLETYNQSTAPLIAFYQKLGLLLQVKAAGTPNEICGRTLAELRERNLKTN